MQSARIVKPSPTSGRSVQRGFCALKPYPDLETLSDVRACLNPESHRAVLTCMHAAPDQVTPEGAEASEGDCTFPYSCVADDSWASSGR